MRLRCAGHLYRVTLPQVGTNRNLEVRTRMVSKLLELRFVSLLGNVPLAHRATSERRDVLKRSLREQRG